MPGCVLWGRNLKVNASTFSTVRHFICIAKGKTCVFSDKVVVSAGKDWSGDTSDFKEVSGWIARGSSVSEVMDFVELVFVGART
jgi:hypothetical protein